MRLTLSPKELRRRSVKKEMLRAALAENLATIHGTRPRPVRRKVRPWLYWALAFTATAGTFASLPIARSERAPAAVPNPLAAAPADGAPGAGAGPFETPRAVQPGTFHLTVRKIILDPGHGGTDPGALTRSGLPEKDITLDIARKLAAELRSAGYAVAFTRAADESVSLRERVELANRAGGDLLLSIHVNSIPVAERRGVETYCLGAAEDPAAERLAGAENSGSGYSLADFRRLLEGIYADVRHNESGRFAAAIQARLYQTLRKSNPDLQDRGVKRAPFVVLIGTTMPAALAEVACLSNDSDVDLLGDVSYRQGIAQALAAGVQTYAAERTRSPAPVRRAAAH